MQMTETDLLDRVKKCASGCWEWQGAKTSHGYGNVCVNKRHLGVHRVLYLLLCGEITRGMMVLHKCDNPACCNPVHLFLGTHRANMADMAKKGRAAHNRMVGENHPQAVLTNAIVIRARSLAARIGGRPAARAIAAEVGLSESTVRGAIKNRTWSHL